MSKLRTALEEFEDKFHPLHLKCRLVEMGLEDADAIELAKTHEVMYNQIIEYVKFRQDISYKGGGK